MWTGRTAKCHSRVGSPLQGCFPKGRCGISKSQSKARSPVLVERQPGSDWVSTEGRRGQISEFPFAASPRSLRRLADLRSQSEVWVRGLRGGTSRGASVWRDHPARELRSRDLSARGSSRGCGTAGAASGPRGAEGEPGGDAETSPGRRGPPGPRVGASGSPQTRQCVTAGPPNLTAAVTQTAARDSRAGVGRPPPRASGPRRDAIAVHLVPPMAGGTRARCWGTEMRPRSPARPSGKAQGRWGDPCPSAALWAS